MEPVVAKNPGYAPAWATLARTYRSAATARRYDSAEAHKRTFATYEPKMIAAAKRAFELDPDSTESQITYALIQSGPRKWLVAEEFLTRALASDPSNPDALSNYSNHLLAVGRLGESLDIKQRLDRLEPYIPLYKGNLAQALWLNGQAEAAIAILKENLGREGAGAETGLPRIYASLGRFGEAADFSAQFLTQPAFEPYRDIVSVVIELLRTAPAKIDSPQKQLRVSDASWIYVHVGAPERLMEPYEEGGRMASDIANLWHPAYATVRKTERFRKFIRDEGLVDYWRERGWPSFCRPQGADDFLCD